MCRDGGSYQNFVLRSFAVNEGLVDWATIAATVGKGRTEEATDVQQLIRYVQKYGGLPHGTFIADLNAFHKVFVPSGRIIPSSTFGAIADLKLSPDELCPLFACAILKTQASCPPAKVCSKAAWAY